MTAMTEAAAPKPLMQNLWVAVLAGCLIAAIGFGPRSAMGFFQLPMLTDTGWDRTTFALAMAIQNLAWGLGQPVFGAMADRYGSARVLAAGGLVYAAGLYMMAVADAPVMLHVGGGVLVGLGVAACSFTIVMAALARRVPAERRTLIFGLATASGSFGMFAFSPLSQALISALGWSDALVWLGAGMLLIPLLAIPLQGRSAGMGAFSRQLEQSAGQAFNEAVRTRNYLLLISGFFVCGFQVAFITAHFPAYIGDIGLDASYAVLALSLIGLFNIVGSLVSGFVGQRYSKPRSLAFIYICRSIAVTAFLLLPQSGTSVIVFSVVMGLLWLSTVPLTNALVAVFFGTRHLGMLGGLVFLSHQIGSFLGVWAGGALYDIYGSYDAVWWLGVALGLFAAAVHWPIREQAVPRLQPA
ncbi:MAG: MFS transporter [Flavobacteriaceae bacterium]